MREDEEYFLPSPPSDTADGSQIRVAQIQLAGGNDRGVQILLAKEGGIVGQAPANALDWEAFTDMSVDPSRRDPTKPIAYRVYTKGGKQPDKCNDEQIMKVPYEMQLYIYSDKKLKGLQEAC